MSISPPEFGDASQFQSVEINDLVMLANRTWRVTGVYLGASGQESVATLVTMDRKPNAITKSGDCIVPLPFLYGRVYRSVVPERPEAKP